MQYLLDTHCLIWFQENNPQVPEMVMRVIQNRVNTILFSQISLFEIAIKQKIGKLPMFEATISEVFEQGIRDNFTFLPFQNHHIEAYKRFH
jgi:PIN domain nuclease of toxin-antitoxin system